LEAYPDDHLEEWLLQEIAAYKIEQEQIFGDQLPAGLVLHVDD
jgi:hypothetical protein